MLGSHPEKNFAMESSGLNERCHSSTALHNFHLHDRARLLELQLETESIYFSHSGKQEKGKRISLTLTQGAEAVILILKH